MPLEKVFRFWKIVSVKGLGVDIRFRDELKGVINPPLDTKLQVLLINKITRSLNISVKKTNDVIIFSILYIRALFAEAIIRVTDFFTHTIKF